MIPPTLLPHALDITQLDATCYALRFRYFERPTQPTVAKQFARLGYRLAVWSVVEGLITCKVYEEAV